MADIEIAPPSAITAVRPATGNITTIPAEITTKIFIDVLGKKRMDKSTRRKFQALRSVCSQWRAACFSTPEFWSALSVATRRIEQEGVSASGYGQLMAGWFARSGPSPCLELELVKTEVRVPMSTEDTQEVVRLIVEHQPRWKYLSLSFEVSQFWDIFAKAPTDKWRLETLVLFEYQLWEWDRPDGILIEDGKANPLNQITTLKKLVLRDRDLDVNHANSIPNLAHPGLVNLQLLANRVKLENRKLETYTHLVTLSIKVLPNSEARWPDQYPQHPISLPHLKSLTLDAEDLEVLSHLNCRALANFHLLTRVSVPRPRSRVVAVPPRTLKPPVLADFLSRAPDTLSRVTIEGGPVDDAVFAQLLGGLSVCTSKSLTVVAVDRWPSAGEPIPADCCPNLHELRVGGQIGWISLGDIEGIARTQRFTEFVNAKLDREGSKLKELVVEKVPFMVCFPFELLETLEAKGLKVTVMPSSFTL
ncbi:hypothetical protein BKA70DRAFT_1560063 [Coprinopsis sp. MPI-PUGE-AT-0042]|nr:hypothetical protein BKA70DRAFT_1489742 [Coprinopsis sp. MPI-PUGE-AT-0042]KAH6911800.1 hypothetical protein BKA70DRAFT_1560063 [Coprinopsis sp. MPI-PUGE-AT-0042]